MLCVRILPCLDCRNSRVVKGINFRNLQDAGDPVTLASRYEAEGADELVLLDITATIEARKNRLRVVRALREVLSIPLTVGGGIRSVQDAELLLLAGADKISINSAAVSNPCFIDELAKRFGSQAVVLAIDATRTAGSFQVLTRSGTERTSLEAPRWAREGTERGAGEILLTSFDRDGTRLGFDVELISAVRACITTPLIASGGARTAEDFLAAISVGADACLAASLFHFGTETIRQVKQCLRENNIEVRL